MKNKLLSIFFTLAAALNLGVYVAAQGTTPTNRENEQTKIINKGYELAKLLPDSDAVIMFKAGKVYREILPRFLSANHQSLLAKVTNELNEIKADTGFDWKNVENMAIGLKIALGLKRKSGLPNILRLMLLRSGDKIDSKVPLWMAKRRGKYNDEKIGDRTIYLAHKDKSSDKNKSKKAASKAKKPKLKKPSFPTFAVASYNENTLVMGFPEQVKNTIRESQKISADILDLPLHKPNADILDLLRHKPNAVITFGAYFPNGLLSLIDVEAFKNFDELAAAIGSIYKAQGSLEVNEESAFISMVVETLDAGHASLLHDALFAFRFFLKTGFKTNDAEEAELFKIIENTEVSRDEKKVMLSLKVTENAFGFLLSYAIEDIFSSEEWRKGQI